MNKENSDQTAAADQHLAGKTVLIVEDDPFLHNLVADYLEQLRSKGARVEVAFNGQEALDKIGEVKPDLMVLDVVLPGMNGFEVLEKVRAQDAYKTLPVIVLSNLSQPQDQKRAEELGVQEYLVKANFMLSDLSEKITTLLSGK